MFSMILIADMEFDFDWAVIGGCVVCGCVIGILQRSTANVLQHIQVIKMSVFFFLIFYRLFKVWKGTKVLFGTIECGIIVKLFQ